MRPAKDLYKPATRPGTQRKGKAERMTVDHPERTAFCPGCMNDTCKGTCKEFKDRFGR